MATETKIVTLYQGIDSDTQQAIAPRTKTSAVSDENNVSLDLLLGARLFAGDDAVNSRVPINADTLGGRHADYYTRPYNLLDNSDFRNPVNQRGKTSYTGNKYTIDRWRTVESTTSHELTSKGIKVSGASVTMHTLQTSLLNPKQYVGKTLTLCAYIAENNETADLQLAIYYGTDSITPHASSGVNVIIPAGTTGIVAVSGVMLDMGSSTHVNPCIRSRNGSGNFTVSWMALYEGSYTAENLPPYYPKGYAHELLECLRYYKRSWTSFGHSGTTLYTKVTTSWYQYNVHFEIPMRAKPNVTLYSVWGEPNKIENWDSGETIDASAQYISQNGFSVEHTNGAGGTGAIYAFHYEASADL